MGKVERVDWTPCSYFTQEMGKVNEMGQEGTVFPERAKLFSVIPSQVFSSKLKINFPS